MKGYSISFVIPMYNERETIKNTINEICAITNTLTDDYEIIISDDASDDGCADIAEELSKSRPNIKVLRLAKNTKFGGALAAGLKHAAKEIVIYTDSDLPITMSDIKKSVPIIAHADIVTGVSIVKKGASVKRKAISMVYNFLVRSLFGLNIKDVNSGYKVFRKELLRGMELLSRSPFIDAEIFVKAKERGAKILEYPLIFQPRRHGTSKVARMSVILQTFIDMLRLKHALMLRRKRN